MQFALPLFLILSLRAAEPPKAPDVTAFLQKGLFEEEVNRNYEAAIAEYRQAVAQFDKQRQYAATAIFRLAECYRKLGRTNEAQAFYQRITQEFADQTNLVKLASSYGGPAAGGNLASMGPYPRTPDETAEALRRMQMMYDLSAAESEKTRNLLQMMKKTPLDQLLGALPTAMPDDLLKNLLEERTKAEHRRVALEQDFGPEHPEMKRLNQLLKTIDAQLSERVKGIQAGLEAKLEASAAYEKTLLQGIEWARQKLAANAKGGPSTPASITDEEQKEIQRIQALIKNSPDLIEARNVGLTPLLQAASKGQLQVAAFLLDHGADLNAGTKTAPLSSFSLGSTPLIVAAKVGHKSMVELLLSRGAKVNAVNQNQETALHVAAKEGFKAVVQALLDAKADVDARSSGGGTPLMAAAGGGQKAVVELLLAKGADVNAANDNGATALHYANRLAVVDLLIAAKADLNPKQKDGNTPLNLHLATANEEDIARRLIEAGADVKTKNESGQTPLQSAVAKGKAELVELLLERKAAVNDRYRVYSVGNASGAFEITALMAAVGQGDTALAGLMIKHGADINARDDRGYTAISWAVQLRHQALVKLLLDNQADPNLASKNGWTSLHQAAAQGDRDTAQRLLDAKAEINARNQDGRTPLHVATEGGFKEVVALLLDRGADPSLPDKNGTVPFDLVSRSRANPRPLLAPSMSLPTPSMPRYPGSPPGQPQPPAFTPVYGTVDEIGDLLRKHGASLLAPRPGVITLCRASAGQSHAMFLENTNRCNQLTLLELVVENNYNRGGLVLQFPLWEKTRILRRGDNGKTVEIAVNVDGLFKDCAKDMPLEWGDVVDVPEKDHLASENWGGLGSAMPSVFNQCLARTLTVVAKGQTNEVKWMPFANPSGLPYNQYSSAWLSDFLAQRRTLYMASSDLTRVTVKRTDPATQKREEYVIDATRSGNQRSTDLWLRQGDVIEIPEK